VVVLGHSLADVITFGFLQMQAWTIRDRNESKSKTANSCSPKQLQTLVVDMNTTFIAACNHSGLESILWLLGPTHIVKYSNHTGGAPGVFYWRGVRRVRSGWLLQLAEWVGRWISEAGGDKCRYSASGTAKWAWHFKPVFWEAVKFSVDFIGCNGVASYSFVTLSIECVWMCAISLRQEAACLVLNLR
jgi:hypothetical protein